jgi:rod shape-determining protein MreB
VIGFPSARIGLDLGTANTLLYVKGRGFVVKEPSLVIVHVGTGGIQAVGDKSEAGLGRTTRKFRTARPVLAGIISGW